jgi:AP-1 complex subunit gamma-1
VLEKKQASAASFEADGNALSERTSSRAPNSSGGDLLDFDALGGDNTNTHKQNGSTGVKSSTREKSDMDLLSEIFSSQATSPEFGFDPFSAPSLGHHTPATAQTGVNPLDLFSSPSVHPHAPVVQINPTDPFAGPVVQRTPAPATAVNDLFGTPAIAPAKVAQPQTVSVPGPNHGGISIVFECSKPDTWDKQKSILLARFTNHTDSPIVGFNLQVAVPKYVILEMQPPTSTTLPPAGNNQGQVTQTIQVTNSMLGTKNLMLKLKLGFTSKGIKVDHMATQSGFPAGLY